MMSVGSLAAPLTLRTSKSTTSVGLKLGLHRLYFAALGCSGALSGSGREEEMRCAFAVLFMSRDLYARRSLRAEKSIFQK